MSLSEKSHGSAHAIIIICLVVALIGALGVLFYQNFIEKKDASNTVATSSSSAGSQSPSGTTVSLKEFTSNKNLIQFFYPTSWSVKETIFTDQADWYSSAIVIKDTEGKLVAELGTGGQFGGACDQDSPYANATTLENESASVKGVQDAHYGATIIANEDGTYEVYYGLNNGELMVGTQKVQCPEMAVGYKYIVKANNSAIGSVTFGSWNADSSEKLGTFSSYDAAKAYLSSDEMKQVKVMIASLTIGG